MIEIGPVALWLCPNGQACPHGLEAHRFDERSRIWRCTVATCHENPDNWPHAADLPFFDPALPNELPAQIHRRLGLRWWQRIPRAERERGC